MILYEVLRLYPTIVMLARSVHNKTKIGNLSLPAGVMLCLPTVLVHQDHEFGETMHRSSGQRGFQNEFQRQQRVEFLSFPLVGAPDMHWTSAMMEAKMALTTILQRFSFELSPSYRHAPTPVITLQPQYGAHLIVHTL